MRSGNRNKEDIRFEFEEMFTSFHNAETGFDGNQGVSEQEFIDFHHVLNVQFERDIEFRNFVVGVWNLDIVRVPEPSYQGKHTDVYGKNSREQWKFDFHKGVFGSLDNNPVRHPIQESYNGKTVKQRAAVHELPAAGQRDWNSSAYKGVEIIPEKVARQT